MGKSLLLSIANVSWGLSLYPNYSVAWRDLVYDFDSEMPVEATKKTNVSWKKKKALIEVITTAY